MANGHGGARSGSGRPRNQEKYAEPIALFHDYVAADINDRYAALQLLADGGFEEVEIEEVWEPAGLVQIAKQVVTKEGTVNVRELAFPELPPDQLVCVQRKKKTRVAAPDRQANQYLVDRVAGKPTVAVEVDSDPDGALEMTASALDEAAQQLAAWRHQMTEQLSSLSAPLMLPTSPTPGV